MHWWFDGSTNLQLDQKAHNSSDQNWFNSWWLARILREEVQQGEEPNHWVVSGTVSIRQDRKLLGTMTRKTKRSHNVLKDTCSSKKRRGHPHTPITQRRQSKGPHHQGSTSAKCGATMRSSWQHTSNAEPVRYMQQRIAIGPRQKPSRIWSKMSVPYNDTRRSNT